MLSAILKWVTRILGFLSVICFIGIIVTVSMQILSRFLPFSYVWTEELTRYFFLFAICFGAPLALLRNEYINVDLIVSRLSETVRRFYDIAIYLVIFVLSTIMSVEGYGFMELGRAQKSATMPFQMSLIHSSIFWMSLFLAIFSLVRIWFLIRNVKNEYEVDGGGEI